MNNSEDYFSKIEKKHTRRIPENEQTAELLFDICEHLQGTNLFNKQWNIFDYGKEKHHIYFSDLFKVGDYVVVDNIPAVITEITENSYKLILVEDTLKKDFEYYAKPMKSSKYWIDEFRTRLAKRGLGFNGKLFRLVKRKEGQIYYSIVNGQLKELKDFGMPIDIENQRDGKYFLTLKDALCSK